ncbi:hypothetical protein [Mycobacterium haemophilum]|uniref:Uncharacterized protein n=1 Tax=Mycobacterium haemophilum TaxID=29311 RepID=A0A0I9U1J4_9MYCO|nr:hypothetical protein [Mycobacterium haemophilum]KLO29502.1 hypothetical protein ABH39_11950 [Mycobacterium haemophilum]KLO35954.1 hypothetical protein ABH38_13790 [Mycobacterium haemophilum]KLO41512.1 hypothetical protein ABH37_13090 [Mycobacterium haemophilum]KLO49392.1 hypothetical protein ABH36_12350 [Mycobacterium haemophilum]
MSHDASTIWLGIDVLGCRALGLGGPTTAPCIGIGISPTTRPSKRPAADIDIDIVFVDATCTHGEVDAPDELAEPEPQPVTES